MATAPQAAMEMPQQGENPYSNPETMAVYDEMRKTVSPKEFGDELLAGAAQSNPEEVAQFRAALEQIQLEPDALDELNNMVDEILANPENYAEIRAKYTEMGATDDILPEQFDAHFFTALNMAIDQMIAAPSGVQSFAKGGIAELTPVSRAIASYGRDGDTMLAHITPAEARMLRRKGGSGRPNPRTGLPEFRNIFKKIRKALKAVGNAVKDFAKSSVGKVITTVALGFFLGPAAASLVGASSAAGVAAVSGFVGSAGSTLLGGGSLKQALKAGAIGGLTAGAGAGIMGGAGAFEAGSYTGPTTVGGQVDKIKEAFFGSPAAAPATAPPVADVTTTAREAAAAAQPAPSFAAPPADFVPPPADLANTAMAPAPAPAPALDVAPAPAPVAAPAGYNYAENNPLLSDAQRAAGLNAAPANTFGSSTASATTAATGNAIAPSIRPTPTIGESLSTAGKGIMQMLPGTEGNFSDGFNQFAKGATDLFSPGPSSTEVTARAQDILSADTTGKMTYSDALKAANAEGPGVFRSYAPAVVAGIGALGAMGGFKQQEVPISPYQDILTGGPGSAQDLMNKDPNRYHVQYLPGVNYYNGSVIKPIGMAEGGLTSGDRLEEGGFTSRARRSMMAQAASAQQAQQAQQQARANNIVSATAPGTATVSGPATVSGAARISGRGRPPVPVSFGSGAMPMPTPMGNSPYTGGITELRPVQPRAMPRSPDLAAQQQQARMYFQNVLNQRDALANQQRGIAGLAQGGYPRRNGQIDGPGTETSDSIPAMLSDGEFVMTAKAVRGAGKGDRRAGAKRMYALMNQLEKNAARG